MTNDEEWWYNTAKRDLLMAQTLYNAEIFESTALHCQQAAEKALKAILIKLKISVKTHSCVGCFWSFITEYRHFNKSGVESTALKTKI
ncbi:MAG: HEPN domain-containing protein [Candidatus Helarchaeota archaeon]